MRVLKIENLTFAYGKKKIFQDISFSLDKGEILTILGPNGSGKTTLMNCISRFLIANSGKILVDNVDISNISQKELSKIIAFVPQLGSLTFDYTVREFVVMGRAPHKNFISIPNNKDYDIVLEKLSILGISHLIDRNMDELSGGERQLVYISRALVQEPKIIILDEPTSALDFGNQIKTLNLINSLKSNDFIVIMTTHNPDQAFMLNGKVAILNKQGNLVVGECADVMTEEILSKVYGTQLKVLHIDELKRNICVSLGLNIKL